MQVFLQFSRFPFCVANFYSTFVPSGNNKLQGLSSRVIFFIWSVKRRLQQYHPKTTGRGFANAWATFLLSRGAVPKQQFRSSLISSTRPPRSCKGWYQWLNRLLQLSLILKPPSKAKVKSSSKSKAIFRSSCVLIFFFFFCVWKWMFLSV